MARTRGTDRPESSLDAVMREPSTTTPDVIVIDFVEEEVKPKDIADPKKDLWLSTVDGRYSSPIIPVRVGPHAETFEVHKAILTKSEYFSKALDGEFREAGNQAIDLPEEDPNIFSFVVAWLYEEKFIPIKSMSTALVAQPDKGKGKEGVDEGSSDTYSSTDSLASDTSVRLRRRWRRRQQRGSENRRHKQLGMHRPLCNCQACVTEMGPNCWNCGATRNPPPPRRLGPPPPPPVIFPGPGGPPFPPPHRGPHPPNQRPPPRGIPGGNDFHRGPPPPPPRRNIDRRRIGRGEEILVIGEPLSNVEDRMSAEDIRTWSLAYELSIEVYVCAEKYLLQDFKTAIAAFVINSFEVAGLEAAIPAVLYSCKTLQHGVSPLDPLLKKVLSRVGFLQARLGKNFPDETVTFFSENSDLPHLIMREMIERIEEDRPDSLPPMEARHRPFGQTREEINNQNRRRR